MSRGSPWPAGGTTPFEDIKKYLNHYEEKLGDRFDINKPFYSIKFTEHMNHDNLESVLDLKKRLDDVAGTFASWNKINLK